MADGRTSIVDPYVHGNTDSNRDDEGKAHHEQFKEHKRGEPEHRKYNTSLSEAKYTQVCETMSIT